MNIEQLKASGWSAWQKIDNFKEDNQFYLVKDDDLIYLASCYDGVWFDDNNGAEIFPTHFMQLDAADTLAQALKIAVEALEHLKVASKPYVNNALEQIDEALS